MASDFSVDLVNLQTDAYPLEEDEQNVFNMFFYPEYEQRQRMMAQSQVSGNGDVGDKKNDEEKNDDKSVKRSFFKKLLIALVAVAVLFIHAITPVSSLLKVLTSKPVFSIATVLVYISAMYFIIDRL
jgi:hypothetical protein